MYCVLCIMSLFKVDMYAQNVKKSKFVWYPCVHSLAARKVWRLWVHADTSSFWTLHQIPLTLSLSLLSISHKSKISSLAILSN